MESEGRAEGGAVVHPQRGGIRKKSALKKAKGFTSHLILNSVSKIIQKE